MNLRQRVVAICSLSFALGCGGRDALLGASGHTGAREHGVAGLAEMGGDQGSFATSGSAGFQTTGTGSASGGTGSAASGSAGAVQSAGSAGFSQAEGGRQSLWSPRGEFDEVLPFITGSIKDFGVDAAGNVYLASEASYDDSTKYSFVLARVSVEGELSWRQQISGQPARMIVDAGGTIYQTRYLNQVGVLDRRTPEGKWLWSRELNETSLESSPFRMGRDGALYLGTYQGERLWKFDRGGGVVWRWKGPGERAIASVAADSNGTVYLRTWIKPTANLPSPSKGQASPMDGLFWNLDPSGKEISQRLFATESVGDTSIYIENGPVDFVVTEEGQLLSGADTSAGLFDTAGNTLWRRNESDLKPALSERHRYNLHSGLVAGRCKACITAPEALLAFDAEGNQTEILLLDYENELGERWTSDERDNIYVLIQSFEARTSTIRRYHGGSGWKRVN